MLETTTDPPTPSPYGSGIFFQTLRQANANPDDMDASDSSADLYTQLSTAPRSRTATATATANTNATANANETGTGTELSAAARSIYGEDFDKETGDGSDASVHSNASSHTDAANGNANPDPGLASPAIANAIAHANTHTTSRTLSRGASVADGNKPSISEERAWHNVVRNFTPSWFSVCMGTGVVSILLHNLPYNAHGIWYISVVVFGLNVFLFLCFSAISLARYIKFPEIWGVMIKHPSQSLFLGCIPMSLSST